VSGLAAGLGPAVPNRSEIVRLLQGVQILSSNPLTHANCCYDSLCSRIVNQVESIDRGCRQPRVDPCDPAELHNAVFICHCRDGIDHLLGGLVAEQPSKHWSRLDPSSAAQCATCRNRNGFMEVIQQFDHQWHDIGMRSGASTGGSTNLRVVVS
jgi:hypothetical protein